MAGTCRETAASLITSAMMQPGDEKVVAQRIVDVLSARHTLKPVETPATPASNLSGGWDVEINATRQSGTTHRLHLQQNGNRLDGIHQGTSHAGHHRHDQRRYGDALEQCGGTPRRLVELPVPRQGVGRHVVRDLDLGDCRTATWTARRPRSTV